MATARIRTARRGTLIGTGWGLGMIATVGLLAAATLAGLVALWPSALPDRGPQAFGAQTRGARVLNALESRCPGQTSQRCRTLVVEVDGGPRARVELGPVRLSSSFSVGDAIRVQRAEVPAGVPGVPAWNYASPDRRMTLLWLLVAFVALVLVVGRSRGALALVGFALSAILIIRFLGPAILEGSSPLLVALVGSMAVMFVTVGLTYGITPQSAAAVLGISASLLLATVLGWFATHAGKLDGRSGELAGTLAQAGANISVEGIVVAGLVLGALGVVADMAVTQASAVMALRRTDPALPALGLYREAFAVGRDHLVAATHTLVLVYVGATLPLVLVLQALSVGMTEALNLYDIAEPVAATLVGAIALMVSVPLTTALAAFVVSRTPVDALPRSGHVHAH